MREHNIENQIKRENQIIRLKKKGISFEEIRKKMNGIAERTVRSYYHAGLLRRTLKKNGINTDKLSSSILAELGTIDALSIQIELIQQLQLGVIKNRRELRKLKKELATEDDSDAIADIDHNILNTGILNDINSEYKLITNYKDLAEKVIRTMRKEKLEKYSQKTQDFCLQIMGELHKHLKDQLERRSIIVVKSD